MKAKFKEIAVADIERDPDQPRTFSDFDGGDEDSPGLAELAASIKTHGVMEPIIVRPLEGGRYRLVAGERRWRASKMARVDSIPALVSTDPAVTEDATRFVIQVEENLQRKSLSLTELGMAAERLMTTLGVTAAGVASMLHVSPSTVSRWRTALDPAHEAKLTAVSGSVAVLETLRGLPLSSQECVLEMHRNSGRTFSERDIRKIKSLVAPVTPAKIQEALDRPAAAKPSPGAASTSPLAIAAVKGSATAAPSVDGEEFVLAHLRTGAYARSPQIAGAGPGSHKRQLKESDLSALVSPRMHMTEPESVEVSLRLSAARARQILLALGGDGEVSPLELRTRLLQALRSDE